jgi:serine/threonine-protein kinase
VSEEFSAGAYAEPAGSVAVSRLAHYHLEERIGAGGMAVVFRARDERLRRRVALKVLAPALAADEAFRHRFIRESRAAAAVDDPHIIPVFEAGEAEGVLFLAMRYVAGGDVRTLARREGPLSPERALAIISPVASALDAAHGAGLVHRDVKPANMLVDARPGRPDHVYLSDFGLSKSVTSSIGPTRTGQFLGTPSYSAPEQLKGEPVDGRADQYSLACAAFELLCGETPFPRDQVAAVIWAHMAEPPPALTSRRPGLPHAVDSVLQRALAKAPADRFANCRAFADAMRETLGLTPYSSASEIIPHAGGEADQAADSSAAERNILASPPIAGIVDGRTEREDSKLGSPPETTVSWPREQLQAHHAGADQRPRHAAPLTSSAGGTAANGRSLLDVRVGQIPTPPGNLKHRILPRPVMTRRRLLAAAIGCSAAAGLAGTLWEISQPSPSRDTGRQRNTAANATGPPSGHASSPVTPVRQRTAIWQAHIPFGSGAVMAVSGDVVLVAGALGPSPQSAASGLDPGPRSYTLHALSATDGTSKWSFPTQTSGIFSLAATARDVYVPVISLYAGHKNPLYALSTIDGATLWTSYLPAHYGPVVAGGLIYCFDLPGNLVSLNSSNGMELWTYPGECSSAPVAANGVVYVLGSKGVPGSPLLHAVRASDGTRIWDSPGPEGGSLATNGTVVCSGGSGTPWEPWNAGGLWVWRVSDGQQLWSSDADGGFGVPAMAGGVIYAVNVIDGMLHALRASDGKKLWDYPSIIQTTPVVANGMVYAGSSDGGLIALRTSDGTPMWEFSAQVSIGPVAEGNTVYVGDGTKVYAING